jgi:heme/copper-type cytochrome/quinol oxidase subunit 2
MKSMTRVSPIFRSAFLLSVFVLLTAVSPALGETLNEAITVTKVGTQYKVNFTGQTAANSITLNLNLAPGACENILYANGAGSQVTIRNTSSPIGQPTKPEVVVLAGQTSVPTPLCCLADVGQWLFEVGDGPGGDPDAVVTINVTCPVPTLSEWAMIVFSVLLLGMMTYYVVRRRRTAHSVAV